MVEEVELSGRFKGYIAVIYKEKNEQIFYRELVQVIGQAVKRISGRRTERLSICAAFWKVGYRMESVA